MEFRRKLKVRLCLAIAYIILGVLIIVVANITKTDNEFLYTLGAVLLFCGIARVVRHFRNTRSEKNVKSLEIRETDERNVEIMHRAKSMTFTLSIIIAGIAVIALQLAGKEETSLVFAYGVAFLTLLYWICYLIVRRKY